MTALESDLRHPDGKASSKFSHYMFVFANPYVTIPTSAVTWIVVCLQGYETVRVSTT